MVDLFSRLPRRVGETGCQWLIRTLKAAILDGRLGRHDRLPSSRTLAAELGIARNTVLHAYESLLAEGFLVADRQGTRVAPGLPGEPPAAPAGPLPHALSRRARALPPRFGEAVLPFTPGVPDLNAFPWATWARQLQRAWGDVSARQLAQAPPGGEPALRQAIAAFLRRQRGVDCRAEQVFVVAGSPVALDACARLLADAGDTVWLENPGYPTTHQAMAAAGLRIVPVAVDQEGLAPPESLWHLAPPRLISLTPAHQYPLGATLSLERRLALLRRVDAGRQWIIEDDYDSEFDHTRPGQPPLPALQGLVADAPVVYLGTFSKLLYPGLRLAWLVVPRWAAREFGAGIESLYRAGHAVEQRAVARLLESGRLQRHLRAMAPVYRARQSALRESLFRHFGPAAGILGGQAGLHLCLRLPEAWPDRVIVEGAARQGVIARALSGYALPGATADNGLVLGYGMADAARIPELVARLPRGHDIPADFSG